MSVSACIVLLYGTDYLGYAIRSVIDQVDEVVVAYTPRPSHGSSTDLICPDSRDELLAVAQEAAGDKLVWFEGEYFHEGLHREAAVNACKGDIVLVLDADEVWDSSALSLAIARVKDPSIYRHSGQPDGPPPRNWLVNPVHLWRSFNWICRDQMFPTRFIRKDGEPNAVAYLTESYFHFGYAQSPEITAFKQSCHGHKGEWRDGWFDNKFMVWPPPADVHPTCIDVWSPEPFDKHELPAVMRSHPYFDLDLIK